MTGREGGLCIEAMGERQMYRDSDDYTAETAMKLRHLHANGYHVIELKQHEWVKLKRSERVKFIRGRLSQYVKGL